MLRRLRGFGSIRIVLEADLVLVLTTMVRKRPNCFSSRPMSVLSSVS
jgi:hypothetical protein